MSIRVFFGAAFQLRFSYVSAHSNSLLYFFFFLSQNIRIPQSQTFGKTFFFVFQLRFSKNGVLTL